MTEALRSKIDDQTWYQVAFELEFQKPDELLFPSVQDSSKSGAKPTIKARKLGVIESSEQLYQLDQWRLCLLKDI